MDKGVSKADPLAVALGESFDHFAPNVGESAELHGFADVLAAISAFEPLEVCSVAQILTNAHFIVEGDIFGHVANLAASAHRIAEDIIACDLRAP